MSEEWGPWVAHCGTCNPCRLGEIVWVRDASGNEGQLTVQPPSPLGGDAFVWSSVAPDFKKFAVVAYRRRKPRGLTILQDIAREVEREDA